MALEIKPSDLRYKYTRHKATRLAPKFSGKPDPALFDREDLYEVLPMLAAVMDALGSNDSEVLHRLEEVMVRQMPNFISSREEVYDCLLAVMGDLLAD
ncbi:MAG: hypothetical protein IH614_01480 [Desulfuromonadales bacterium]|nr:hypothetical protein [Desulfuromonadales bacterium]